MARIQLRRGTAAQWADKNTILADGEPGLESDTHRLKIGDGVTPWTDLDYLVDTDIGVDPVVNPTYPSDSSLLEHINSPTPHPIYDDGPSLLLAYQNAKV